MKYYIILFSMLVSWTVRAQTNEAPRMTFPRWSPSVRAGSVYNFDSELSGGNDFAVNRYYGEVGLTRMWAYDRMISISAGYGQEDYQFDDLSTAPWNNIDSYRAGIFARWAVGDEWMLFISPSVRSYVETGADLGDGLGASFFGGAGYTFGERLFIGPAIGVFGRIEDDPLVLPILLIDWKITDRLSLGTGSGFAATAGPGLGLTYELTKHWKIGLSGRYESFRFRLSSDNVESNGIGEDESMSILGSVAYELYRGTYISGVIGSKFGGELTVNDSEGRKLSTIEYGSGVVAGLVFGISL